MKYGSGIQYGVIDPTYTPPEGQDILYENVTTGDLWHFDTNLLTWECITCSAATCPLPMTSAALQTHITNSTLMPGCDYTITDHTQGTLGTVSVTVRATSVNTVSHEAMVKTSFHTQAWRGLYDAQNQLLVELRDHQDNIVSGFSGVEIGAFDWGNGNITNCQVSNAILYLTTGFSYVLNGLRLTTGGTLDLTDKVSGSLNNLTVKDDATVLLGGSTVQITDCTFSNTATVDFTNYTGAGNITNSLFTDAVIVNIADTNRGLSITDSQFYNGTFTSSGFTTTAALTILRTEFRKCQIEITDTNTQTQNFEDSKLSKVTIDGYYGKYTIANSNLNEDYFYLDCTNFDNIIVQNTTSNTSYFQNDSKAATSTNLYSISGCTLNKADITATENSKNTFSVAGSIINISGIYKAGNQIININSMEMSGNSSIITTATSTGQVNVIGSTLNNAVEIRQKGSGQLDIQYSTVTDACLVELNGGRRLMLNRTTMHTDARVHSNNLSTGFDILDQVEASNKAIIIFDASGANLNGIRWSTIIGGTYFEAPTIQFLGTSSGQEITYSTIDHSQVLIENCSQSGYQRLKLDNGAFLKARNITATKSIYDVNISNSILDVYDCTVAGDITKVYMRGIPSSSVVTGTAAGVSNVYSDGSPFGVTAGSLSNVKLSMGGVFNNGGFTQTNVIYNNPSNITCTVANTNATTITGITSSNPVV